MKAHSVPFVGIRQKSSGSRYARKDALFP